MGCYPDLSNHLFGDDAHVIRFTERPTLPMKMRLLIALAAYSLVVHENPAYAQGTAITYQGRLDSNGIPATGNYDLIFGLFTASDGTVQVGNTITNLNTVVTNGLIQATLDFGPGVFNGSNLWLQIGVRLSGTGTGYTALAPRQPVTASPYSLYAQRAGYASIAGTASGVNAGAVSAPQLNTAQPPSSGQVLAYNGVSLAWTNVAGTNTVVANPNRSNYTTSNKIVPQDVNTIPLADPRCPKLRTATFCHVRLPRLSHGSVLSVSESRAGSRADDHFTRRYHASLRTDQKPTGRCQVPSVYSALPGHSCLSRTFPRRTT